jgi:hypothetical protein
MSVTSAPARANIPPKKHPTAPAPMTAILFTLFSFLA